MEGRTACGGEGSDRKYIYVKKIIIYLSPPCLADAIHPSGGGEFISFLARANSPPVAGNQYQTRIKRTPPIWWCFYLSQTSDMVASANKGTDSFVTFSISYLISSAKCSALSATHSKTISS